MKKVIGYLAVGLALLFSGNAIAADTHDVTVSAEVLGSCTFNTPASALAFGVLPFDGAGNALGAGAAATIQFQCTNGAAYSVSDDDGLYETGVDANRMASDTVLPVEYIAYSFTYVPTSGTGVGYGTSVDLDMTGTIAAGAYTANSPDTYSDTVVLSITP